jgi:Spy/CpxP family protein refolding chaperone
MSKKFLIPILSLVFAAGLLRAGQVSFALPRQDQGAMSGPAMGPMTPENRLKMLTEKLSLTDDQQAKVKPLLEDEAKQMKAVHDDTSLAMPDKRTKMKGIHDSFTEKMNAILTPDQQTKWKQMKQEMMEKHKGMQGGDMNHQ